MYKRHNGDQYAQPLSSAVSLGKELYNTNSQVTIQWWHLFEEIW